MFGKTCKAFLKDIVENVLSEQCKGGHCVDLDESFQALVYLQNVASIQPRTSLVKFAASRDGCGKRLRGAQPSAMALLEPQLRKRLEHALAEINTDRANFTGLLLGCIDANI